MKGFTVDLDFTSMQTDRNFSQISSCMSFAFGFGDDCANNVFSIVQTWRHQRSILSLCPVESLQTYPVLPYLKVLLKMALLFFYYSKRDSPRPAPQSISNFSSRPCPIYRSLLLKFFFFFNKSQFPGFDSCQFIAHSGFILHNTIPLL